MTSSKITTRYLIGGFLLIAVLLITVEIVSVRKINILADQTEKLYAHPLAVSNAVLEANAEIIAMHRYMKDVVLARDKSAFEKAVTSVEISEQKIFQHFNIVIDRFLGDKSRVMEARKAFIDWKTIRSEVMELSRLEKYLEAAEITKGKGADHVVYLTLQMDELIVFARNKAAGFLAESRSVHTSSITELRLLIVVLLLAVTIAAFFAVYRVKLADNVLLSAIDTLNETGSIAKVGGWDLDIATGELNWTDETFNILEVEKKLDQIPLLPEGLDLFTPDSKPIIEGAIQRAIEFGEPYSLELEALTAKGNVIWVYMNGRANYENGKIISLSGTIQDISLRKTSEIKLVKSEERYKNIVEGSNDIIIRVNSDGKIKYVNHISHIVFGISPEACVGLIGFDFIHPEDRDATFKAFHGWIRQKKTKVEYENRNVSLDGQVRDISWHITIQYDKNGAIDSIDSIGRDITKRKKMEVELNLAVADAEKYSKAKSEFLANMSHELRTPLNAILGFSQMLKNQVFGSVGSKTNQEYVALINDSGQHLLDIVSDILDLTKVEAGKEYIDEVTITLPVLVDECRTMITERAVRKNLSLELDVPDKIPALRGDVLKVKQVLLNLMSNAVKFTPENGIITVMLAVNKADAIEIMVTDTGIGIAAENISQVTNPFEQLVEASSHSKEGTGLGLAISKRLVELHGGTLGIESEVNEGTTVTVTFPAERTIHTP